MATIKRNQATPHARAFARIRRRIKETVNDLPSRPIWKEVLGYTAHDLKAHIELLFSPEMNWEAFCRGEIYIDHKTPRSKFTISSISDQDFKRCWCLDNLQPLWAADNSRKGSLTQEEYAAKTQVNP